MMAAMTAPAPLFTFGQAAAPSQAFTFKVEHRPAALCPPQPLAKLFRPATHSAHLVLPPSSSSSLCGPASLSVPSGSACWGCAGQSLPVATTRPAVPAVYTPRDTVGTKNHPCGDSAQHSSATPTADDNRHSLTAIAAIANNTGNNKENRDPATGLFANYRRTQPHQSGSKKQQQQQHQAAKRDRDALGRSVRAGVLTDITGAFQQAENRAAGASVSSGYSHGRWWMMDTAAAATGTTTTTTTTFVGLGHNGEAYRVDEVETFGRHVKRQRDTGRYRSDTAATIEWMDGHAETIARSQKLVADTVAKCATGNSSSFASTSTFAATQSGTPGTAASVKPRAASRVKSMR